MEQAAAAQAAAAAVKDTADKKNAAILDDGRRALAQKAAEREAKKAGEEAGARALADAHLEKRQFRDVQLNHVSKLLMTHARCADKPVRASALKALAVLCYSGICSSSSTQLASELMLTFLREAASGAHSSDRVPGVGEGGGAGGAQTGGKGLIEACIIFEGILLLCGPDDVEHMLNTAGIPALMQHCLTSMHEVSAERLQLTVGNARLAAKPADTGCMPAAGGRADMFGCQSSKNPDIMPALCDLIQRQVYVSCASLLIRYRSHLTL